MVAYHQYWAGLPWAYPYAYVDVNPAQGQGLPERRLPGLHGALVPRLFRALHS